MKEVKEKHNESIEQLQRAIDVECAMVMCYTHLVPMVANGRIRAKLRAFANRARENTVWLKKRLEAAGVKNFSCRQDCSYCKTKMESFSLHGILTLGIEISTIAIQCYKKLLEAHLQGDDKARGKMLLKEKLSQKDFLKKERKFQKTKADNEDFINTFCLPKVILKL